MRNYRGATWRRRPEQRGIGECLPDVTGRYRPSAWPERPGKTKHHRHRQAIPSRSSVRAGSVSQRSSTGSSGHQRSPTVWGNRKSPGFRLNQQGRCKWAIRIVVPTVEKGVRHPRLREPAPMSPPTDRSIVTTAAEPRPRRTTDAKGVAMPGQPAHFEIPADDTAKGRQFWGSLFDWQFEGPPGPFEYHITRISDQAGLTITNMEPGKRGIRTYFYVDDINAGAARVKELGGEVNEPAPCQAWGGSRPAATPRGTSSACGRTTCPPRPQPGRPHQRLAASPTRALAV